MVEIWQREEKALARGQRRRDKQEWKLVQTRIPLRLGKPLPLLPFIFHGPNHSQPGVDKLPLGDIITVNLDWPTSRSVAAVPRPCWRASSRFRRIVVPRV